MQKNKFARLLFLIQLIEYCANNFIYKEERSMKLQLSLPSWEQKLVSTLLSRPCSADPFFTRLQKRVGGLVPFLAPSCSGSSQELKLLTNKLTTALNRSEATLLTSSSELTLLVASLKKALAEYKKTFSVAEQGQIIKALLAQSSGLAPEKEKEVFRTLDELYKIGLFDRHKGKLPLLISALGTMGIAGAFFGARQFFFTTAKGNPASSNAAAPFTHTMSSPLFPTCNESERPDTGFCPHSSLNTSWNPFSPAEIRANSPAVIDQEAVLLPTCPTSEAPILIDLNGTTPNPHYTPTQEAPASSTTFMSSWLDSIQSFLAIGPAPTAEKPPVSLSLAEAAIVETLQEPRRIFPVCNNSERPTIDSHGTSPNPYYRAVTKLFPEGLKTVVVNGSRKVFPFSNYSQKPMMDPYGISHNPRYNATSIPLSEEADHCFLPWERFAIPEAFHERATNTSSLGSQVFQQLFAVNDSVRDTMPLLLKPLADNFSWQDRVMEYFSPGTVAPLALAGITLGSTYAIFRSCIQFRLESSEQGSPVRQRGYIRWMWAKKPAEIAAEEPPSTPRGQSSHARTDFMTPAYLGKLPRQVLHIGQALATSYAKDADTFLGSPGRKINYARKYILPGIPHLVSNLFKQLFIADPLTPGSDPFDTPGKRKTPRKQNRVHIETPKSSQLIRSKGFLPFAQHRSTQYIIPEDVRKKVQGAKQTVYTYVAHSPLKGILKKQPREGLFDDESKKPQYALDPLVKIMGLTVGVYAAVVLYEKG